MCVYVCVCVCVCIQSGRWGGGESNLTYMECAGRLYVGEDQVLCRPFAIATMFRDLIHQSIASNVLRNGRDTERERERERERGGGVVRSDI